MGSTYQAVPPSCNLLLLGDEIPAPVGSGFSAFSAMILIHKMNNSKVFGHFFFWGGGITTDYLLLLFALRVYSRLFGQVKWSWRRYMNAIYMCVS